MITETVMLGHAARARVRPGVVAGAGAAAVALVGTVQLLGTDGGPELCVFRRCLGVQCPGCGGARAAHHLLHGEVSAAWTDHPWVVLAAAQVVFALAVVASTALRRGGGSRAPRSWRHLLAIVGILNVIALAGVWVVRFVDGSLPGTG